MESDDEERHIRLSPAIELGDDSADDEDEEEDKEGKKPEVKGNAVIECCVCKDEATGAHRCLVCKQTTHTICGKHPDGVEEGHGAGVICNNCTDALKTDSNTEHISPGNKRKASAEDGKWWLKAKVVKTTATDVKKKDPTLSWGICVTCYSSGETPDVFRLSRRDKSTFDRHAARRHPETKPVVKPYNDKDEIVSKAREFASQWDKSDTKQKTKTHVKSKQKPTPMKKTPTFTRTVIPAIFDVPKAAQHTVTKPPPATDLPSVHEESFQAQETLLHSKIDTLISEFRDFKLQSKKSKDITSTPLTAIDGKYAKEVSELLLKWSDVKNVIDLVDTCSHIRFFAGDESKGILSVIRCETCFRYISNRRGSCGQQSNPEAVAKKGLGGYCGSLATGLVLEPDKTARLLEGGCQEFYNLKTTIKSHITLAGGQLHFEALQFDQERNKRKARAQRVTENLVSIALTVVKVKAAARHYETMVAAHAFTGSDVGEFGHGRKQFPDIMRCAEVWINRETATFLSMPLPSTKLPPHFYVTSDKSTPHRITNQAIMICLMIDGERHAIAVNAPEVYGETDSGIEGDVSGAAANELAESLYKELQKAYPTLSKEVINGCYQGTVCDGAYQAAQFEATLKVLCDQENAGDFFAVLWDPPHYVDLAFKDVFDGKIGSSKEFVHRLVERSSIVHRIFQRGKMLSHATEMAKDDDELVLRLTSRACSTRFSASQYVEFLKLIESLPLYIRTFREFKYTEVKEYQIAGMDFLLDLCSICDILKPYMQLSVALQGLSVPCWKVIIWWKKLHDHMENIENTFSFTEATEGLPMTSNHGKEIISGSFKNTELVQGWLLVSSETNKVGDKMETVDNWKMRDEEDVEADIRKFMEDLRFSFQNRMDNSSKPLIEVLTCLDVDSIVRLLCGKRLPSGKVKLQYGEGALEKYGRDNFQKFFSYVCSLPHVKRLSEAEGHEESLFDEALANTVFHNIKQALKHFLWKEDDGHLKSWFNLPQDKTAGHLVKMEIADEDDVPFSLGNLFSVTLENAKKPFRVHLNEDEVYKSIYTNEELFDAIGIEGCICIDIALSKGGTEAVVESYYSVMSSQKMSGGQVNETLGLRTKIDWCLPPCQLATRAIKEISEIYLEGDKQSNLPKHAVPILGDRAKYKRESKVMKRHRLEDARLSYLL